MPLYEYECTACHRRTEKIQKYSDPELTVCPHCGGPLERTITAAAISFKGGGWYKDGYASHKPASSSEGSEATAAGAAPTARMPTAAVPAVTVTAPPRCPQALPATRELQRRRQVQRERETRGERRSRQQPAPHPASSSAAKD